MSISFEGIGHKSVTFPAGNCTAGYPCKIASDGRVTDCFAGEKVVGVIEQAEAGWAGVQLHGFVTLPYSGTAPTVGFTALSANGSGGVKADATNGRAHLVVEVNQGTKTVTFEL